MRRKYFLNAIFARCGTDLLGAGGGKSDAELGKDRRQIDLDVRGLSSLHRGPRIGRHEVEVFAVGDNEDLGLLAKQGRNS